MNGPEGAAQVVATALQEDLPVRLAALGARLGLPPGALVVPQLIQPRDEMELRVEDFPAVLVVPMEALSFRAVEAGDIEETFLVRYSMRVYCWVRGEHAEDTDLARKRLTLAVRETLLGKQTLAPEARVDGSTLVESYSDLGQANDQATLAAAFLAFEMVYEETVRNLTPTLATVNSKTVDVGTLLHPGLQ